MFELYDSLASLPYQWKMLAVYMAIGFLMTLAVEKPGDNTPLWVRILMCVLWLPILVWLCYKNLSQK